MSLTWRLSNDTVRHRMSKTLLDFGVRIQESVFECVLNAPLYERMMQRLEQLPLADSDRVRVYRVCGPCLERVQIYGPGEVTQEPVSRAGPPVIRRGVPAR